MVSVQQKHPRWHTTERVFYKIAFFCMAKLMFSVLYVTFVFQHSLCVCARLPACCVG